MTPDKTDTSKIIAVDFDGTCCTHDYPEIGKDIGAIRVLKALTQRGHKLILYTMRSNELLLKAEAWLKMQGVELWGVNENPEQHTWTNSRKVYANVYIDDAAAGCPLIFDELISNRPFVDWNAMEKWCVLNGLLSSALYYLNIAKEGDMKRKGPFCRCLHEIENKLPRTKYCFKSCSDQHLILEGRKKQQP